jgi:hypothetical protein
MTTTRGFVSSRYTRVRCAGREDERGRQPTARHVEALAATTRWPTSRRGRRSRKRCERSVEHEGGREDRGSRGDVKRSSGTGPWRSRSSVAPRRICTPTSDREADRGPHESRLVGVARSSVTSVPRRIPRRRPRRDDAGSGRVIAADVISGTSRPKASGKSGMARPAPVWRRIQRREASWREDDGRSSLPRATPGKEPPSSRGGGPPLEPAPSRHDREGDREAEEDLAETGVRDRDRRRQEPEHRDPAEKRLEHDGADGDGREVANPAREAGAGSPEVPGGGRIMLYSYGPRWTVGSVGTPQLPGGAAATAPSTRACWRSRGSSAPSSRRTSTRRS